MRALLGSLALALAATLLTLLAAEGVLRLRDALRAPGPPARPAPSPYPDLPQLHSLKDLIRPNTRGVFKGVLHRTNSRGVRGPEYTSDPAPGVFRIEVIGDSYTMGQGVAEDETYAAVAERLLSQRGRRVEVINLGVSGLAIRHSIRRLEKRGLGYHPDLVVYGFTPNDILGPDYREGSPEEKAALEAWIHRFDDSPSLLLRTLWPRLVLTRSALWPLPGTYEYALEQNYFHNPPALRQITDGLDDLARLTRDAGICGLVFVHTRLDDLWIHPFTRIYRLVASLARERGLSAYVSFPHFRGRDVHELRISDVDSHPNAAGHRLHAEALVEALESMPPRCWQPARDRSRQTP
jgi:lysophospholipase L1-like esterase